MESYLHLGYDMLDKTAIRPETVKAFDTAYAMFYEDTGIDEAVLSLAKVLSLPQKRLKMIVKCVCDPETGKTCYEHATYTPVEGQGHPITTISPQITFLKGRTGRRHV